VKCLRLLLLLELEPSRIVTFLLTDYGRPGQAHGKRNELDVLFT